MFLIILLPVFAVLILFMYTRLSCGLNRSSTCLIGKTALVTGANSGLGYQICLNLASRGCRLIMADVADMKESKTNIIAFTNNDNIVIKKLDLSSFESVRNFAADILKSEEKLDILINNAGIAATKENRTLDNLHPVMQVNYFGHFLLTHLLINLLQKSAPSRIIFTTSLMSIFNNLTVENFNFNQNISKNIFQGYRSYANSKLAVIIASDILAEKLKGTGVSSNCVHPGLVSTKMFFTAFLISRNIFYLVYTKFCHFFFGKDPWEGSQSIIHAAISKRLEGVTGELFSDCKPHKKPSLAYDREFSKKIWKLSEEFVGLRDCERIQHCYKY